MVNTRGGPRPAPPAVQWREEENEMTKGRGKEEEDRNKRMMNMNSTEKRLRIAYVDLKTLDCAFLDCRRMPTLVSNSNVTNS